MTPTLQFIHEHANADVLRLALQAKQYPDVDIAFALRQIEGRQKAKRKLPTFYNEPQTRYPAPLALEQCSSETAARYKATLVHGNTLTDLTGGFGIDTFFISDSFAETTYVEQNSELCQTIDENFKLFHKNICIHHTDCVKYLQHMPPCDCIFIDPARRDRQGRKTVALSDCTPDLTLLYDLLLQKAKTVLVKLSPMLDISLAVGQLPATREIHIVAVENECKEILFRLCATKNTAEQTSITAINMDKNRTDVFCFTTEEEQNAQPQYAEKTGHYLYEPNAAILKAGAFKCLATRYQLQKLHPNTHLYTADALQADFCGRIFEIESVCTMQKQNLKTLTAQMPQANIAVRNFPLSTEQLRQKLRLPDGGDTYLFGTTVANGQHVLLKCRKA